MLSPIKVVDIELSQSICTLEGLEDYVKLRGLVRLHGTPIGYINAPITAGRCEATTLSKLILEQHSWTIIHQLMRNGLAAPTRPEGLRLEDLFDLPPPACSEPLPLVTVAVCTRDRPEDMALCLEAINQLDYPHLDLLVIDNAPTSDATKELIETRYPHVRYVREPRPGLDWARNRAILEAKGEIIAYTDDDVVVDPGWVKALAQVFAENPEVMAVTGLVVPYELETEAQILFEQNGGFGRGFNRKWYHVNRGNKIPWYLFGTGEFGTGANMAYRRSVFEQIGGFNPALDVGTVTNGAGDLEMFFRIIKEGHALVYEPSAMIRHRHRRSYQQLRTQLTNNGSVYSYFVCAVMAYPEEWWSFIRLGVIWFGSWHLKRLITSFTNSSSFPRDLILAEIWGCLTNLTRYQKAKKVANQISKTFGPLTITLKPKQIDLPKDRTKATNAIAVRAIELTQPISSLDDITDYANVRFFVMWNGSAIGHVDLQNQYQRLSASRLREAIVNCLGLKLLKPDQSLSPDMLWAQAAATLARGYSPLEDATTPTRLPEQISVSVIVGTFDRPDDLRNCLRCLVAQQTTRAVEIIIVDNHPASGLTPPVVAEFPGVRLISESRQGVAYARNAGITASSGDIVVTTDDDTTIPPDWLEKIIVPFARADVMAATGNVLPVELETASQQLFEQYGSGGLGRGYERFEATKSWFRSSQVVPTWLLGGTANAAFRASIFTHPEIGLMDEALGPGMPSGVGEDIYIFYKILKAGYTIVYEPGACVWHTHRRSLEALRRQLYGYSKGYVSYSLTTLLHDHDWRVLKDLLIKIPLWHLGRIKQRFQRRSDYSIPLVLLEMSGHLIGPWSLWQSRQRVKRWGRSTPYTSITQRSTSSQNLAAQETLLAAEISQYGTISNLHQI
jgi:GT2 family glycosyltransferase